MNTKKKIYFNPAKNDDLKIQFLLHLFFKCEMYLLKKLS